MNGGKFVEGTMVLNSSFSVIHNKKISNLIKGKTLAIGTRFISEHKFGLFVTSNLWQQIGKWTSYKL